MSIFKTVNRAAVVLMVAVVALLPGVAADHNDPNPINSIFADIDLSPGDLYDFFGFPSDDTEGGEKVVVALTFAPAPSAGAFDPDMLYRILLDPDPRLVRPSQNPESWSLDDLLAYATAVDERFGQMNPSELRITVDAQGRATVKFVDFAGGSFTEVIDINQVQAIQSPDGHAIKAYIGARDDAFFNDLPGFFRSINYAPQFYNVPWTAPAELREIATPKTLLELEGNDYFNFDPNNSRHGDGVKLDLPSESMVVEPTAYKRDANGNYRFVYSGKDAQAGINVNALVFEIPLAFLTPAPQTDRVVNAWGESWVLKAATKIETIPDESARNLWPWLAPVIALLLGCYWLVTGAVFPAETRIGLGDPKTRRIAGIALVVAGVGLGFLAQFVFAGPEANLDEEMRQYKLVDSDGVPFADAALSERAHSRQLGANNLALARGFAMRTAHLGWGFGPSLGALGLASSFDYGDQLVPVHRTYALAATAFPRVKGVLLQELNMPDDSWRKNNVDVPLKRGFEVFIPNVCAIDMDTTGTWPFGHRLEDQVATRFLSLFLDMSQTVGGVPVHVDTLSDQALWDAAPIEPKTPPNPLANDKDFLDQFPYLADTW